MNKNLLRINLLLLLTLCTCIVYAQTARLHSIRIGSSGNLLTVNAGNGNQVSVNEETNTVVFIHRNDPSIFGGNVATYRYDISKNKGATWQDNKLISIDPKIDNYGVCGRFPQGLIYNPKGNTIADSAYLIYTGSWHNGSDGWKGEMRGRGKLTGDSSAFNVHVDSVNSGAVNIGAGFCQGAPGVFWNVNQDYPAKSFVSGTSLISTGVIVEKGVWNNVTKDVDWTERKLPATFMTNALGTTSSATSFNIAFDPTGQYGWIACLGDITNDGNNTLEPVFWKTTDAGLTWTGPEQVHLYGMPEVVESLHKTFPNGDPTSRIPTTAFDEDLAVDYLGNPHMIVVVGNNSGDYSIQQAYYDAWDFTYDAQHTHKWKGIHLGEIETLRGSLSNDNPAPQTQDNRPLVSRTADGKKLFFFWLDSDIDFIGADQNDLPNLFGRAIDVSQNTMTPMYNFSEGDSLWGAETSNTAGGIYQGIVFHTVSPIALTKGNIYNIPLVTTQIDYNHDPADGLGSYLNPASFCYIDNIDIPVYDFRLPLGLEGAFDLGPSKTVCSGSHIILNPVIGEPVPPYTYDWNYSGDALSCTNCKNPSVTITENSTYELILTDADGKEYTDTISFTVSGPTNNMSLSLTGTGIDCLRLMDTTDLTITNGQKPFNVAWGDGNTSIGLAVQQHNYSKAGAYVVSVTDSFNCVTSVMDTVTNNGIHITVLEQVRPNCPENNTGKIKLSATGGVVPYTFSWSNGAGSDSIVNLKPKNYFVTVTDDGGCSATEQYYIAPLGSWDYHAKLETSNSNCGNNGAVNTSIYKGRAPYSFLWSNSSTTQNISGLSAGNYVLTVTDSLGCVTNGTAHIYIDCKSTISGVAFIDSNNNCLIDGGEKTIEKIYIHATNQNTGRHFYASSGTDGKYDLKVTETGTYSLNAIYYSDGCSALLLCGSSPQSIVVNSLGDTSTANNFSYTGQQQYDLSVFTRWTTGNPGFAKSYYLYPLNNSYYPFIGQATVTFSYDSRLVFQSTTPNAVHDTAAHTLTWNVNDVQGNNYWWNLPPFAANFMVPVQLSINTELNSSYSISPTTQDCNPDNNNVSFTDLVRGSYDPNEKEVSPSGSILETDSILTYTIHFQNTGNDSTHFVIVTDTLPAQLDPATVNTIAASHPYYTFNMKDAGTLTWTFDPLRLVDSITDPVNSKGFIRFTVKKRPNLPIGTTIQNRASIYFDYNTPVLTNTISDTISFPDAIFDINSNNGITVKAYPNPFSSYTNIVVDGINEKYEFELYDVTGRVNKNIPATNEKQLRIYRGNLASGIYFYRITTLSGKNAFGKLVIE